MVVRFLTGTLALMAACASANEALPPDGGGGAAGAQNIPDAGTAGFALSFDGVRQYATSGNGGFPQAGATQTVEMWAKVSSLAARQTFVTMRMGIDSGVVLGARDGTFAVWRVYVDRVLAQAPAPPAENAWHHVAYTFDLTNHSLYVDGALAHTQATGNDTRTPVSVFIGSFDGSTELLQGELDEVRVWTVARSAAEVLSDMHDRSGGAQQGLVAHWSFDDVTNGGRSADLSGRGNDVTLGDGIAARMPGRVASAVPEAP